MAPAECVKGELGKGESKDAPGDSLLAVEKEERKELGEEREQTGR